jgi:phosphoglycerate dehydrogenase-like enzyme
MPSPCVVIAKDAFEAWKPLFEAAALPMRYAVIHDPETAILDGNRQDPKQLPAEVIWLTLEALRGPLRRSFKHLLENAPELRWVHSIAAGYDMPIAQNILKRGVRLTTSHVSSISIAEYVMRAVLEHFQRADLAREARARKEYPRDDFREVYHTTWLIYGLGAIGSQIAQRASAFGAHTIGVRRNPSRTGAADQLITPAEVAQHVGRADVLVLSAPSTGETQKIVNAEFISRMKPGAALVNISRAALVDEAAVLAALDSGQLDWAMLDVHSVEEAWLYRKERMDGSPLWLHPKITLSPHAAAHGNGRHARGARLFIDNLRRYTAGEPLPDEVWLDKA